MTIENNYNRSLTTTVFEQIRDDILNNKFKLGDKLVEAQIASDFHLSRTPIREALKQLELEGLVEHIPNRGMIVKGISDQDVEDIYAVRAILEEIAVKWAIERSSEDLINELVEIHDLMEFYTFKDDFEKFLELSTQFHETIYSATKSRYLKQVLTDYQFYVKISRKHSIQSAGRIKESLEEYGKILKHIQENKIDLACQAMIDHIHHIRHKL